MERNEKGKSVTLLETFPTEELAHECLAKIKRRIGDAYMLAAQDVEEMLEEHEEHLRELGLENPINFLAYCIVHSSFQHLTDELIEVLNEGPLESVKKTKDSFHH